MPTCNPFQDVSARKPLFQAVYATILIGIFFSTLFIISSRYSASAGITDKPFYSFGSWFSSTASRSALPQPAYVNSPQNKSTSVAKELDFTSTEDENLLTRPIWDVLSLNSKMPDLKAFTLSKKMVDYRARDNVIIVTFGNYAFMDFILNWVKHLTDLNVFNLIVGAMDIKLLEALYRKGVPVFDMGSNMNTIDVGWGSPTFHKMGREKVFLINALLPYGYELLMCDTDMVWLKNPLPYLARFPQADILTSSDQVIPTVTDDSLEIWQQVSGAYNIGIFHWRPSYYAQKLAKEWKDLLVADENLWDQTGFNDLVHKVLGPSVEGENDLVYAYDGKLKLGILPSSIFCSGHTYFVQAMFQQLRMEPYAVHTTFQFAGTEGKRHRLREAMVFHDEPAYYDSSGGFLSFKPRIPKALLFDGAHTLESHFMLVNYQLNQIRTALAIASLANRTLVMPPLWCRFDRMWFGHPGVMNGTLTRQPFLCPMDHVFEVNVMLKSLPEDEFGRKIGFREYSFLQNPRLPKMVKESYTQVQLCEQQSTKCLATNETNRRGILIWPKHSSEEMILRLFSLLKDIKVIEFLSMIDAFEGFYDKEREAKFRNRVKRYAGIWCCVMNRDPGHVYYDMYWDEKPGWKPEPPATREVDHPPW
ncbi:hypothetical protein AXF42_Ash005116 [Apostasia shenzhenica]|uniref:Nucleotide-diphospho-sugar transferase domain-containing protein n=1 Tax=Apostasia shenzhenica TaxID=1088818 RepID=A0A2I0B8H2_9ASPA|nr:hypothetical protein AXF42_Ash005116 [Apostasia shenzhenica]